MRAADILPGMQFPNGFLWGSATSAHQVEGGNVNNDCWLIEHLPGSPFAEPSGDACDHYHRYPADVALLAELGLGAYRFSVEWARVEPEEGEYSRVALEHYRRLAATCRERGVAPIATLHHFTSPRWLVARGGWLEKETAERFARYCGRVREALGDLLAAACTINEINIPMMLVEMGLTRVGADPAALPLLRAAAAALGSEPGRFGSFLFADAEITRDVLLQAHRLGADALRAGPRSFPVGVTLALQDMQALPGGEAARDRARALVQDPYLEAARGDDFVGVQTYSRERYGPDGRMGPEAGVELTQMGYEFWPEALEASIRRAAQVARVPIYVTENGIATSDDARRIEYVRRALRGVARCLQDGIDVRGYLYWSAFDNFEWLHGYAPTFGLLAVDRETQVRTPKPSAAWLGRIARANRIDDALLADPT